jgi:C-terminal processing protease CtpA/Prc
MLTLDVYQLEKHPKIGVIYLEQFAPSGHYDSDTYFEEISETLFTGITALKRAGVKHVLLDISGNRGGYIQAGAIALWSLWPRDLYPGSPPFTA